MAKSAKNTEFLFTSDVAQIICSKIKQLRLDKQKVLGRKITQEEFGKLYDMNLPYIKGIMQGRFAPSHDVLAKIAKQENISMDWFFGLVAEKEPIKRQKKK